MKPAVRWISCCYRNEPKLGGGQRRGPIRGQSASAHDEAVQETLPAPVCFANNWDAFGSALTKGKTAGQWKFRSRILTWPMVACLKVPAPSLRCFAMATTSLSLAPLSLSIPCGRAMTNARCLLVFRENLRLGVALHGKSIPNVCVCGVPDGRAFRYSIAPARAKPERGSWLAGCVRADPAKIHHQWKCASAWEVEVAVKGRTPSFSAFCLKEWTHYRWNSSAT